MDPFDAHGDALCRAIHAHLDSAWPDPHALDRIRSRTSRGRLGYSRGHDWVAAAALIIILLITLGGS